MKEIFCPDCGCSLIHMEGCLTCPKCGWSECERTAIKNNEADSKSKEYNALKYKKITTNI